MISPTSDGLTSRVMGPWEWPRVRCTIARAKRGGGDSTRSRVIDVPFANSAGAGTSPRSGKSGRAGARRLQGRGPPQQIVDHRPGGGPKLGQSSVDITALVVSPQSGDRDVDR